jgi:hypothetical protein
MAKAKQQDHARESIAMARYISRRAVETEITRKGEKLRHYSFKQIVQLGDEYLREHYDAVMREVLLRNWERRFEPMRDKGSAKTAVRKPHGMGFFRALFVGE